MSRSTCLKRLLIFGGGFVLLLVIGLVVFIRVQSKPLPQGQVGEEADALAQEMLAWVNHDAWQNTGAIQWNFDDRQTHLWDKQRHLARVRWDNLEVLINLTTRKGRVFQAGEEISEGADALLEQAWAHWANDSFWLNPVSKVFDEGTTRALVEVEEGHRGLLLTYASGGVTPGDSYLWVVDASGQPVRWEMWVSILPIGGLQATWDDWRTLENGLKISQKHDLGIFVLDITDVAAASSAAELENGIDPFARLFGE